jgi:hypothetical protein
MTRSSLRFRACLLALAFSSGCVITDPDADEPSSGDPTDESSGGNDPSDESSDDSDESSDDSESSGDPETTGEPVPTDCPAPTAGPTMHAGNNVEADEVWTADGSPHLVPYDFTIHASVVVEPCARVQLGGSLTLTVADDGELVAEGTEAEPIVFERLDPAEPWTTIRLLGGNVRLAHAVLDGGGRTGNTVPDLTGALLVAAHSGATAPEENLRVEHVEIRGSQSAGVRLEGLGGFTLDSDDLVITQGAAHPISASATMVGSIPAGDYTGNGDDQIVLTTENTAAIFFDTTIYDRGVPYFVGLPGQVADLRVQANPGGLAVLTIEPGVELRFQPDSVFVIDRATGDAPATGALVAVGTEDRPIVLTSAEAAPAAGDWLGVYFGGTLAPVDRMDYVHVEYAGGASTTGSNSCPYPGQTINDAAIRVFGVPPGPFVTNTVIAASASHGIDRGWRDDVSVEMQETNSFDVNGCTQTWSRLDDGTCPDPVPCP